MLRFLKKYKLATSFDSLKELALYLLFLQLPLLFSSKLCKMERHCSVLDIDSTNNNNINVRQLGGKGLHLNQSGSNLLSKKFMNVIEKNLKNQRMFRYLEQQSH